MKSDPTRERSPQPQQRMCVACPRCGQGYRVPARLLGRRLQCRHCREKWRAGEISVNEFQSGRLTMTGSSSDSVRIDLPDTSPPSSGSGTTAIDMNWAGRRLGRYKVISVLGRGGMGVVWRAHDDTLRRDAALKILNQQAGRRRNGGMLNAELFMQEARAIAKLQHPAVVSIFEVGEDSGQIFLALELMEGGTLKDYVERYGAIPPRELCAMLAEPAKALALAHRRGIIHRDIKPTNLMFDEHGHLKLMDFGLADVAQEVVSKRMRGKTVGSMGWIAPETARGQGTTASSDIYGMGLVMLYALTGRPWLKAHSRGELMALHKNPPPLDLGKIKELNSLSPASAKVLKTCLAVEQADRFLSADRLANALRDCANEKPEQISRQRTSHASVALAAAMIGGLLVAFVALRYFNKVLDTEIKVTQPLVRRSMPLEPQSAEGPERRDQGAKGLRDQEAALSTQH